MATPQQAIELTPDQLQKSYVADGLGSIARKLAELIDIETSATAETYEQMSCDADVAAALYLLVYSVLADGVQISPAVSDKDDKFEKANEITEHLQRTIDGLDRPLTQTLEMMLTDSLKFGNKVAEKVYYIPTEGPDANKLILQCLKVKRRGLVAFVVDSFWNLIGLTPSWAIKGGFLTASGQVIPPEKFVIFTYRMKDEDPRGTSWFKAVVKAWKVKSLSWPEFLVYMMRCAIPGLVGKLSSKAQDKKKDDGTGNTVKVLATDEMLAAMEGFRNSYCIAIENDADVTALEVQGEGRVFERAFKNILSPEIRKGLLLQELATADSTHQTKGSTSEQMGVVDMLVWATKAWVADIVRRQILMPQVGYNFGEMEANELTPTVSLGDSERKDWADDGDTTVALATATRIEADGTEVPLLTYSQIQSLLTSIGIPPPTEEEVKEMRAAKEERRKEQERMKQQTQPNQTDDEQADDDEDQQQKKAA